MMSNRVKIIILIIALLFIAIFINRLLTSKDNATDNETSVSTTIDDSQIKYDEDTGEYYIQDEETGEITHTSENKSDLEIYTVDPDYEAWDPNESENTNEVTEVIDDN